MEELESRHIFEVQWKWWILKVGTGESSRWEQGVHPNKKDNNPPKKCTNHNQPQLHEMRFWSTFGSLFDWTCWSLKPWHLMFNPNGLQAGNIHLTTSENLICILFNQEWGNVSFVGFNMFNLMQNARLFSKQIVLKPTDFFLNSPTRFVFALDLKMLGQNLWKKTSPVSLL